MDRIDIFVDVPRVDCDKLTGDHHGETSADVRTRVAAAAAIQQERLAQSHAACNVDTTAKDMAEFCRLTSRGKDVLHTATRQLHLSARAYHRVLKVSRTIAARESADLIDTPHVAEALQYRKRERDQLGKSDNLMGSPGGEMSVVSPEFKFAMGTPDSAT